VVGIGGCDPRWRSPSEFEFAGGRVAIIALWIELLPAGVVITLLLLTLPHMSSTPTKNFSYPPA
jgi:hypothetical protein